MRDLFGLHMSVGAILGCQESASAAIAEAIEDARSYDNPQPVKHADETGWREGVGRSRAWLWTVVTTQYAHSPTAHRDIYPLVRAS
jgi:transposase